MSPPTRFEDFRIVANSKRGKKKTGADQKAALREAADVSKQLNDLAKEREYAHRTIDGENFVEVRDKKTKRPLSRFKVDAASKKKPVRVLRVKLSAKGTISPKKIFDAI